MKYDYHKPQVQVLALANDAVMISTSAEVSSKENDVKSTDDIGAKSNNFSDMEMWK